MADNTQEPSDDYDGSPHCPLCYDKGCEHCAKEPPAPPAEPPKKIVRILKPLDEWPE